MPDTVRIAMWSGPRNISTAMMRAWESRADCAVVDEPFYGAYLATTGLDHPMAREIMAHHPTDWDEIALNCATDAHAPIVFQKHMTQHMIDTAPRGWMAGVRHAFLIRPPGEVAVSFHDKWEAMTARDLGFHQQVELFDHVTGITGAPPPVVEARDVLSNPEGMMSALCAALGVPFDRAMLSWAPGARASDGIWASHWYASVNASTGFAAPRPPATVPEALHGIVEECRPAYEKMAARKLNPAAG